jgi:malonyl-CoA O-methyltransferase
LKTDITTEFGRAAGTYVGHARVQTAAATWLAEWVPIARTGRALEIGAGPGIFTRHLVPWSGQLLATDASREMCEKGWIAWPQVEWKPMLAQMPESGPWDWIFTSSMLQWINNPEEVFSAWRKILAPRGKIVGVFFADDSLPELRALMNGWSPVIWKTPAEWQLSMERAGLRVVRMEPQRVEFRYDSAREFLRSLHGVGATPERRLSVGELRRLLREYDRLHRSADGVGATWTFCRFEAECGG